MQNSEKLCLKWNDFQENLNSAFGGFRNDHDFADVTLACEDGTQIETQKVILASSSPFFMKILKKNKHPHPLINMRGLKAEALVARVDFLYYGEANVNQESLDVFLGVAEELKLKGLLSTESKQEFSNQAFAPEKNIEEKKPHVKTTSNIPRPLNTNQNAKTGSSSGALVSVVADQLEDQIKSMMIRTNSEIFVGKKKVFAYACTQCGKEGQWTNIKTHIEANHIASNISHACDICGKISR